LKWNYYIPTTVESDVLSFIKVLTSDFNLTLILILKLYF
jgi:hypothetical protein